MILEALVLLFSGKKTEGECKLQSRSQCWSLVGIRLGDSGSHSRQYLVKHGRFYVNVVEEGVFVLKVLRATGRSA